MHYEYQTVPQACQSNTERICGVQDGATDVDPDLIAEQRAIAFRCRRGHSILRTIRRGTLLGIPIAVLLCCWTGDSLHFMIRGASSPFQRKAEFWCNAHSDDPDLWIADVAGAPVQVKVLTYNLEWWSLFEQLGGLGGSAGKLIAAAGKPQPFDIMGFQECQDPFRVLTDAGLLPRYTAVQGAAGLCFAYMTASWTALAQGEEFVGEDQPGQYFGKRSAQWVRLQHKTTGKVVFFVNHHGPLTVNSGGICGGKATAGNLLRLLARSAVHGDSIVLLGDFNADANSETVLELAKRLYKVYAGVSYGGVDNIFSNVKFSQEAQNLGGGGSDHSALAAVIDIAGSPMPPATFPGVPLGTTTVTTTTFTSTTISSTTFTSTTVTPVTAAIKIA
mmetsp:Transcript_147956/g.368723  ORF Transcript_147956/g.368723 Transcript_147956/m.368723 type:complete len:389 (-) Transcript_147956:97-1263(-)